MLNLCISAYCSEYNHCILLLTQFWSALMRIIKLNPLKQNCLLIRGIYWTIHIFSFSLVTLNLIRWPWHVNSTFRRCACVWCTHKNDLSNCRLSKVLTLQTYWYRPTPTNTTQLYSGGKTFRSYVEHIGAFTCVYVVDLLCLVGWSGCEVA